MIVLATVANEKSVYWITINFLDEDNNAMTPDVATWTLTDLKGNIFNSREDVSIVAPGSEETIELSGNDLVVDGNDIIQRIFTGSFLISMRILKFVPWPSFDVKTILSAHFSILTSSADCPVISITPCGHT